MSRDMMADPNRSPVERPGGSAGAENVIEVTEPTEIRQERARLARRAVVERVRKNRQAEARADLMRLPDSPALCSLVRAGRYMSRRGVRLIRRWAESEDPKVSLPACRLLVDLTRILAALRQAELALGVREADAKSQHETPATIEIVEWPSEGTKA